MQNTGATTHLDDDRWEHENTNAQLSNKATAFHVRAHLLIDQVLSVCTNMTV